MSDNRTTELREKLNKLIIELDRLDITLDSPGSDMTLGEYEQEREKLLDGFMQAIAATLGSDQDQELIDLAHNAWSMALCAMQGMPIPAEWGDAVEQGLREHGIDVDEELAAFEVIDDER